MDKKEKTKVIFLRKTNVPRVGNKRRQSFKSILSLLRERYSPKTSLEKSVRTSHALAFDSKNRGRDTRPSLNALALAIEFHTKGGKVPLNLRHFKDICIAAERCYHPSVFNNLGNHVLSLAEEGNYRLSAELRRKLERTPLLS